MPKYIYTEPKIEGEEPLDLWEDDGGYVDKDDDYITIIWSHHVGALVIITNMDIYIPKYPLWDMSFCEELHEVAGKCIDFILDVRIGGSESKTWNIKLDALKSLRVCCKMQWQSKYEDDG